MLRVTRDLILPTAITGSPPRPLWYEASLHGRRELGLPEARVGAADPRLGFAS